MDRKRDNTASPGRMKSEDRIRNRRGPATTTPAAAVPHLAGRTGPLTSARTALASH
jgi:hypothetical protein